MLRRNNKVSKRQFVFGENEMNEKTEVILSVLIPLYNSEAQIEKAIRSVLNGNCDNVEIIVIDDGSTDRSGEIVCGLAKRYSHIKYFRQENENNIYSVRKKLIEKARGKYLVFLDSDDFWENNALDTIIEKTKEDADIILFDHNILKGDEIKVNAKDYENDIGGKSVEGLCLQLCANNKYNALWNKCFKKELFENNSFFRDEFMNMGEDAVLSLVMLAKAKSVAWINKPLYDYVINSTSISSKYKLSYCDDFEILYGYMKEISLYVGVGDRAKALIGKQYVRMMSLIFLFVKADKKEYKKKLLELKNNKDYLQSYNEYSKEMPFYLRLLASWIVKGRVFFVKFVNSVLQLKGAKALFLRLAGGQK